MANLGNTIINGILRVNGKINAGDSITAPSFIGDLAGNAATATKASQLTTARTINGTSFNGTANITTANWGTARTIKIGNSGKSVNGSANVTWTLAEIGAAASSHTHSYLPLAGGTMTGALNFDGGQTAARNITWTGGTYQQRIAITDDANSGTAVFTFQQSSNSGTSFSNLMTIGDNGKVTATTFAGALSGNATTATSASKLTTARTISLSGDVAATVSFDGSKNVTLDAIRRGTTVGLSGSGTTNPWFKFASISTSTVNYDAHITFNVYSTYNNSTGLGILKAHLRTNSSGQWSSGELIWLAKGAGISASNFVLAHNTSTSPTVVELWCKCTIGYQGYSFDVIAEGQRTNRTNDTWTLYNTWTNGSAAAPTSGLTQQTSTMLGLSNNVATATKLQTARTIGVSGVTGTAQSFDGSKNIVIPITAVPASLLTGKSSIKGSEITNDKHWVPSSDNSVTNFVAMDAATFASDASSLATGTIVAITDGVEGYVTTQATSLTCDLPLDL